MTIMEGWLKVASSWTVVLHAMAQESKPLLDTFHEPDLLIPPSTATMKTAPFPQLFSRPEAQTRRTENFFGIAVS